MRICLDVNPLIQPVMTGVQIVTLDVVKQLLTDYPNEDWVLFCFTPNAAFELVQKRLQFAGKGVEKRIIKVPSRLFHRLMPLWQRTGWPTIEWFVGHIDYYHSFEWFHAPSKALSSATIQDWSPMVHPEWYTPQNVSVFKNRFMAIQNHAKKIVVISKFLNNELKAYDPKLLKIVTYIPNGIPSDCVVPEEKVYIEISNRLHVNHRFMLAVGTLGDRKNYSTLLKAYRAYRKSSTNPLQLVIVSQLGERQHTDDLDQEGVILVQSHTRKELMALYSQASALFFPSWYEGFGLPLLEAMNCGCPVVSSDIPTAHEIGGTTFRYVNPGNVDAWVVEMKRLHQLKDESRVGLKQSLISHADRYNLKKTASLYHSLFVNQD